MKRLTAKNWENSPHLQIEPTTQEEYDSQRLYTRLAELEDKLESGRLIDVTREEIRKTSMGDIRIMPYLAREGDGGQPMIVIPLSEELCQKLLTLGIENCLNACIILE